MCISKCFMVVIISSIALPLARAADVTCRKQEVLISSRAESAKVRKLYQWVENVAELGVYYGDIRAKKVKPVSKVLLTQTCRQKSTGWSGVVLRFQVEVQPTPRSQIKRFFCYSKAISYSETLDVSRLHDQGTFCSLALRGNQDRFKFPKSDTDYGGPLDPYSVSAIKSEDKKPGDIGVEVIEFQHSKRERYDFIFDPFFDTRSAFSEGPDTRGGSGL